MPEQQISAQGSAAASLLTGDAGTELQRLIGETSKQLGPIIDQEQDKTQKMVDDLVSVVLKGKLIKGDLYKRISQAIAWLDKRLTDQVNVIIHHPEFQAMESAWTGLKYLVDRKPPGQQVQVRVLNISKKDLSDMMARYSADSGPTGWTQSPLFKQVFNLRFDMPGGNPFGCLVGDYQFDKSPPDIGLLGKLSAICGAAHSPFISAAAPGLVGLKSWREMPNIAELEAKMSTPEYAAWNSLRESPDSRFLSLTLPRFMGRLPYGKDKNPVNGFNFEEDLRPADLGKWSAKTECLAGQFAEHEGKVWRALRNNTNVAPGSSPETWEEQTEKLPLMSRHDNYCWANAAYPMAANIMNTFFDTGFCTAIRGIEGGGKVEGLPIDTFPTDDGGVDAKCPTEVAISQSKEAELSNLGFMPLSHWQNTDYAAFVGGQTVQKPAEYSTALATDNAKLSARLPYVFLLSRFSHYLKKMIYEWVGTNKERAQLEQELNEWIMLYASAPNSAEDIKQEKPLADARIEVKELEGQPGQYEAFAYLRPHIQLESVTVNLGVVSKVPGGGA